MANSKKTKLKKKEPIKVKKRVSGGLGAKKIVLSVFLLAVSIFVIYFLGFHKVKAAGCNAASSGNWNTPGTWSCGNVPTASDDVTIATGAIVTMDLSSGAVAQSLSITGTLAFGATTYTLTVGSGGVAVNSGGNITGSAAAIITTSGSLIANSTSIASTTVSITMTGASTTISGTGAIPFLTVNNTVTNNGILTVSTKLAGSSTLTNGASATLNIGATAANLTITGLDASSNAGNTVNYNGTAQTVKPVTYANLSLSTSGVKTLTGVTTINGNLTTSGTAVLTATTAANMTIGGDFTVGSFSTFTTGSNYTLAVTGNTTVTGTLANSGTAVKTYYGDVTINNTGAFRNANNSNITFKNDLTANGVLDVGSGIMTFDANSPIFNCDSAQTIAKLTVNGVTLTNNCTSALTVSTALDGTGGVTQGTNARLTITGTSTITTLTATASGNYVRYGGSAQTVKAVEYYNLELYQTGLKTLTDVTTIDNNLTLWNSATGITGANLTVGGALLLGTGCSLSIGSNYTFDVTGTLTGSGTMINSGTGVKIYRGSVTNSSFTNPDNSNITFQGNLTNNGTLSLGTGTITFDANAPVISGNVTIYDMVVNGVTVQNGSTNLIVTHSLSGTGTFNQNINTKIYIGGTCDIANFTATNPGNTVIYNGSSQTIRGIYYRNLTINQASGSATLGGDATVALVLTLTSGNIVTGSNSLYINVTGSVSRNSGYIIGNLKKYFSGGALSKTFEIGDSSNYTPADIAFGSITTPGDLTISTTAGDHPNISSANLNPSKSVNRYWTATNSGIVFNNYSAIFNFINPGDLDGGTNTSNLLVGKWSGSAWSYPTVGTKTSTSTQTTGLTSFSDFQLGELGNTEPTATTPGTISQYADASGYISFQTTIADGDSSETKLKVEYSDDGGTNWYDPDLVSAAPNNGAIDLDDVQTYQVGTVNGIDTDDFASVTLTIVWDTKSASNGNGTLTGDQSDIKVRVTPNDFTDDGTPQSSANFEVDNLVPTFVVNEGTEAGPVATDTINVTAADANLNASSVQYGFSADSTCNGSDTYGNSFTNSTDFTISTTYTDYLCVKGADTLGNVGYQLVGKLNVLGAEILEMNIDVSIEPEMTISLSKSYCEFGNFIASEISTCSYDIDISTNASNGYVAYIRTIGNFSYGSNNFTNVSDGYVTANYEEYGLSTSESDSVDIVKINNGLSCTQLNNQGITESNATALATTDKSFAIAFGTGDDSITLCHSASISGATLPGSYSQTVIITIVASF
ncbi:MAG: hypothetical protein NTZ49_04770 [Candidatus Parcubacteria bacterium]|nr:hypothetical protein [Candidatus Parcubacteria bacterium]